MSLRDLSDEELMVLYKSGDSAAFDPLYERYKQSVYNFLRRQVGSSPELNALFQDIWLQTFESAYELMLQAKFNGHLFRVAHQKIIQFYFSTDALSARLFDRQVDEFVDGRSSVQKVNVPQVGSPDIDADRQSNLFTLSLEGLPAHQREVFLLHEEACLTFAEISQAVDCSEETVMGRYQRAIQVLRSECFS